MYKTKQCYLLFLFLSLISMTGISQNIVSYAYDNAGNRISRQVVNLTPPPTHAKKQTDTIPAPVKEELGDRKISIYPNPTKGALGVDITGGDNKDELTITLFSAQGVQLQRIKAVAGMNPLEMSAYAPGWYIMRIKAGDKLTEFKIVKQ
ncbi:MAG: T9SS type A sorting domain-containing protein [Paludibacter sp.]